MVIVYQFHTFHEIHEIIHVMWFIFAWCHDVLLFLWALICIKFISIQSRYCTKTIIQNTCCCPAKCYSFSICTELPTTHSCVTHVIFFIFFLNNVFLNICIERFLNNFFKQNSTNCCLFVCNYLLICMYIEIYMCMYSKYHRYLKFALVYYYYLPNL